MKREAPTNTKMRRLCRALDLRLYQAVGLLELLWHLTARETPRGDIGKLSNEDIAVFVDYVGDENELIAALVRCGWLDEDPECRLLVHDWHIHADESVKKRLTRSGDCFIVLQRVETKPQNGATNGDLSSTRVRARPEPEPEPQPEPEPAPEPKTLSSSCADGVSVLGKKEKENAGKANGSSVVDLDEYQHVWNAHSPPLKPIKAITPKRAHRLRSLIHGGVTLTMFAAVVEKIAKTPFLVGGGTNGWCAGFDWLLESDNLTRVAEGTYDDGPRKPVRPQRDTARAPSYKDLAQNLDQKEAGDAHRGRT